MEKALEDILETVHNCPIGLYTQVQLVTWHQIFRILYLLFSIIMLTNLEHSFLYHKEVCTIFYSDNEQNAVKLLHSAQQYYEFLLKTKEKWKPEKHILKKNVFFVIIALDIRTQVHKVITGWI